MIEGLWYISAAAGFTMIAGAVYMLSRRILVLDSNTGQYSTEITLPFNIKVTTNLPVILMFLFGGVLLLVPIWLANEREKTRIQGETVAAGNNLRRISLKGPISYPDPVKVYVVAAEKADAVNEVNLEVPHSRCGYTVSYWCANGARKLGEEAINLTGEEKGTFVQLNGYKGTGVADPLCTLKEMRREDPNATNEFK